MITMRIFLSSLVLLSIALALVSCGNSNKLQSMSLTPATADAKDYANGQVQFTATGTYTNGSQVKPLAVLWSPGPPWTISVWAIQLDSTGVASCGIAPAGTYPVWAGAPIDPHTPVSRLNQATPMVSATAHLTCP